MSPQRGDNSLAILSALESQNVAADTLPDVSIKSDQTGIHGARDLLPCGKNHLANIAKQRTGKGWSGM